MNLTNKLTGITAGILVSLGLGLNTFAQNRSIEFDKSESLYKAKIEAKKSGKQIFADCYTAWCLPCKIMDKNIFTNDSVADFYNENFVNMKVDMESDSGKILAKKYTVESYPTFLYFDSEGKLLQKAVGKVGSSEILSLGRDALNPLNPEKRLDSFSKKYENGNRDSEFIYEYLNLLKKLGWDYQKIHKDYLKNLEGKNLASKTNWKILFFDEDTDIESKSFKYLLKNKEKFDSIYTPDSVDEKISEVYLNNLEKSVKMKDFWVSSSGEITPLTEKIDSASYAKWKEMLKKQDFYRADEVLEEGELRQSEIVGDWTRYSEKAVRLIEYYKKDYDYKKLNEIAKNFYKNIENNFLLEKALFWSKKSIESSSEPFNNETYAHLLYALGDTAKAIEFQEKAIELLKKSGDRDAKTNYYTKILGKMRAGEKLKD